MPTTLENAEQRKARKQLEQAWHRKAACSKPANLGIWLPIACFLAGAIGGALWLLL